MNKRYGTGDAAVTALADVDVAFAASEFTAVMGPSGSGKSTLLHCMAGLDTPDSGSIWVGDVDLTDLKDKDLTELRRDRLGFVFQQYNLIPTLDARENIELPLRLGSRRPEPEWFDRIVDAVRIRDRLSHRPSALSGGQQQRVAVARALVSRPEVVFADEPTGNLDSNASTELLEFLRGCVDEMRQTIVMVTHDALAAAYTDRVVFLADGRIVSDLFAPTPDTILDRMKRLEGPALPSST